MTANCHHQPPLQVYGEAIKHVTDFKYLGSQMASSAGDFKRRKALALAWGAFWKLERLWRSSELPISTKIKLFHTTCVTILLYGCESRVLSQDMECKINAFATSSYRVMLNIKRRDHVLNTIIYSMTDTQPLVHCVRKRQLSFLGHVLRLPEEEPVRRYALYIPPHSKRRPGRPYTSYQSYIKRLLGYDEDDMSADQIATLAQDRCAWRNLVIACSAAEGWWWWWWMAYFKANNLASVNKLVFFQKLIQQLKNIQESVRSVIPLPICVIPLPLPLLVKKVKHWVLLIQKANHSADVPSIKL